MVDRDHNGEPSSVLHCVIIIKMWLVTAPFLENVTVHEKHCRRHICSFYSRYRAGHHLPLDTGNTDEFSNTRGRWSECWVEWMLANNTSQRTSDVLASIVLQLCSDMTHTVWQWLFWRPHSDTTVIVWSLLQVFNAKLTLVLVGSLTLGQISN
jgi:hypothetical protein